MLACRHDRWARRWNFADLALCVGSMFDGPGYVSLMTLAGHEGFTCRIRGPLGMRGKERAARDDGVASQWLVG